MKKLILAILMIGSNFAFGQNDDTEWDDYFMPGIGYKMYVPKNKIELGIYQGVMTEFVIYAKAKSKSSEYPGPSRIKTYANLSIMSSDKAEVNDIFYTNLGLNLSFEGRRDRKYMIPYFGLELGGMFQRNFSTFQLSPVAGIQVISTKTMLWNIQGGYQYTVKRFDELSGYVFSSTLNVLLWNKED